MDRLPILTAWYFIRVTPSLGNHYSGVNYLLFLENNNTNIILRKNEGRRWKKIINTVLDKNISSFWDEP
jgi:hypothetical protein